MITEDGYKFPQTGETLEELFVTLLEFLSNEGVLEATGSISVDGEVNANGHKLTEKYKKPASGIPKADLTIPVQTMLNKAASAYQLPENGMPKTDLSEAVRQSLSKADSAIQEVKLENYITTGSRIENFAGKCFSYYGRPTISVFYQESNGDTSHMLFVVSHGDSERDGDNFGFPCRVLSYVVDSGTLSFEADYNGNVPTNVLRALGYAVTNLQKAQSAVDVTVSPNVLNVWGSVNSLTVAFAEGRSGVINEYMLQFTVGSNNFTLKLPNGVKWIAEPEFSQGSTYQVSIVNNLAVIAEWGG